MTWTATWTWLIGALLALCFAVTGEASAIAGDACASPAGAVAEAAQDCDCIEGQDTDGSGAPCDEGACVQCHCVYGAGVGLPASPALASRLKANAETLLLHRSTAPPSFGLPGPDRPPRA